MDVREEGSVLRYTRQHENLSTLHLFHINSGGKVCSRRTRGNRAGRATCFRRSSFGATRFVFPALGVVRR